MAGTAASGRKGFKSEFEAACMLNQSAGILIAFQNLTPEEAKEKDLFSEFHVERRRIALEVFKKLAPSCVDVKSDSKTAIVIRVEAEEITNRLNNYSTVN